MYVRPNHRARAKYEAQLASKINQNSQKFFAHLQRGSRLRNRKILLRDSESPISDPASQAEIFAARFPEFYRPNNGKPTQPIEPNVHRRPRLTTKAAWVRQALEAPNPYNGAVPDTLYPRVLKILAPYTSEPLAALLNFSLASAEVPEDWIQATVCQIYKNGTAKMQTTTILLARLRPFAKRWRRF